MPAKAIIAAAITAAAISGQAFAYSNVAPKQAPHEAISDRRLPEPFNGFDQPTASWPTAMKSAYAVHGIIMAPNRR